MDAQAKTIQDKETKDEQQKRLVLRLCKRQ
jgi:hypothetical protein